MGRPQPRSSPKRETLRRCKSKVGSDKVIVIDVDGDSSSDVTVISSKKKQKSSVSPRKHKECQTSNFILIDDDDESTDSNQPVFGCKDDRNLFNDASSGMRPHRNPCDTNKYNYSATDDYLFSSENTSPLNLSTGRRTYSGRVSGRNRYGLSSDSEFSSESDSDCELMEDSCGKLREQWLKAFSKRKNNVHNEQGGPRVPGCASTSATGVHRNVRFKTTEGQHDRTMGKSKHDNKIPSPSVAAGDNNLSSTSCNSGNAALDDDLLNSIPDTQSSFTRDEGTSYQHFEQDPPSALNENNKSPGNPAFSPRSQQADQVNYGQNVYLNKEGIPPEETCPSNSKSHSGVENSCHCMEEEEVPPCMHQNSVQPEVGHVESSYQNCNNTDKETAYIWFSQVDSFDIHRKSGSLKENKISSVEYPLFNRSSGDGTHDSGDCPDPEGTLLHRSPFLFTRTSMEPGLFSGDREPTVRESSCFSECVNKDYIDVNSCQKEAAKTFADCALNCQQEDGREDPPSQRDSTGMNESKNWMITEREMLKETDEYKRALEQEMISRQQALQIQSEEAQRMKRLLKRKKAEHMRMLEMEKRQKQRLEEMRETQKKDEEHMNMKEAIRSEVRKKLSELEAECRDMASLLRGLGIGVGGGLHPSSHEVRSAYKRAQLTFHPDRASKTDIRQLVEAEEKFKLISRMNEKLLPTT